MLNRHDLEDLKPTIAHGTEREAKDHAAQGYYTLLDVDCMKWFNYSSEHDFQAENRK